MTEFSSPPPTVPAATGPTPEEISARLEALLKRTQALRDTQKPAQESGPLPWPPPDGELDALELVDVPPQAARTPDPAPAPPAAADEVGEREPEPPAPVVTPPPASTFERPDWTSLRLRDPLPAPPRTPGWLWLLVAALVVALGLETAYLLHTAPWSAPSTGSSTSLTIEGDERLRVRIGDGSAEPLPLQREVSAGDRVRVVVELNETAAPVAATDLPATATEVVPPPATEPPAPPDRTGSPADRPSTTGAVLIETIPPGALVTMEGRERGRTPITIEGLRPGRHDVLVAGAAGIAALKVDVVAGETTRLDASRP